MTTWILPLLAALGLAFALWSSLTAAAPPAPGAMPPVAAYAHRIAATGVVETLGEETSLAPLLAGTVSAVLAAPGAAVAAGAPLVQLDDREARAALAAAQAQVAAAQAQADAAQARVAILVQRPRPEDVRPVEAALAEAQARFTEARDRLVRGEALSQVIATEDLENRRQAKAVAAAAADRAAQELAKVRAGTWAPELAQARAEAAAAAAAVAQAEAAAAQARVVAERHLVRAPAPTTVLRVRVRAGEAAVPGQTILMTLGDATRRTVRAQVDERDAARLRDGAQGVAVSRGDGTRYPLAWLRTEPLVVPKRTLTGDTSERVDTRVVEVLLLLQDAGSLRIGQQVDVELDTGG